jgi:hypothetical protein
VSDYLHQDELYSLVSEINEQLSDLNSPSFADDGRQSSQRLDHHFIHPKDSSRDCILLVHLINRFLCLLQHIVSANENRDKFLPLTKKTKF